MSAKNPDISFKEDRYHTEMPMLTHKFKEYFFHHEKADTLICLEFNKYPNDLESYHLEAIQEEKKVGAFLGSIEQQAPTMTNSDSQASQKKSPLAKRNSVMVPAMKAQGQSPSKKFNMGL